VADEGRSLAILVLPHTVLVGGELAGVGIGSDVRAHQRVNACGGGQDLMRSISGQSRPRSLL
jgi:hypothetical protein